MPVPPGETLGTSQSAVIITSHSHLDWTQLVEGIVESAPLPCCCNTECLNYSVQYNTPWKLQNKYYTTVVQLSVVTDQWPQQLGGIKEQAEAIIVYWDNTQQDCLAKLNKIIDQLDEFKPEVCLLVCDGFTKHAKLSRYQSTQWCVAQGWELVELLSPEEDDADSDDLEDDFKESSSYNRIRGALYANCWTSMTYHQTTGGKDGPNVKASSTPGLHNLLPGSSDPFAGAPASPSYLLNSDDEEDDFNLPPPQELDESFDDLFSRFEKLRVTAASLPREDRLNYAERVAMAFLESMGEEVDFDEPTGNEEGEGIPAENVDSTSSSVSGSSAAVVDKAAPAVTEACNAEEREHTSEIKFERLEEENELEFVPSTVLTLEELGFPILKDVAEVTNETKDAQLVSDDENASCAAGDSSGVENVIAATELPVPVVDETGITDALCEPSYDAIEQEFADEEIKKAAALFNERKEFVDEVELIEDHNKKVKL